MIKNQNRGFTLIELLVVIAIIGILASVVLASLSTARSRGKDAAIKAAVSSAITQAEIDANGQGYNLATVCSTTAGTATTMTGGSPTFTPIAGLSATMGNIAQNVGKNGGLLKCAATSTNVAFWSALATSTSDAQCVDNNGYAGTLGAANPVAAAITAGTCK